MKRRATAVIKVDSKVLLVREKRSAEWSLPGGTIDRHRDLVPIAKDGDIRCSLCLKCSKSKVLGQPEACERRGHGRASGRKAIERELFEELSVRSERIEFLFDHYSTFRKHSVYQVAIASTTVHVDRTELDDSIWWDGSDGLNLRASSRAILERYGFLHPKRLPEHPYTTQKFWKLIDNSTIGVRFLSALISLIVGIASLLWWLNRPG